MQPISKILFVTMLTLISCSTAPAKAEVYYEYPKQFSIQSREINETHSIPSTGELRDANEEKKLDIEVLFAPNSDKLLPKAMHEVAKAAMIIKKHMPETAHVLVEGFTDSTGRPAHNQSLSYRRALRVVNVLEHKFGIPAQFALAKGFGSSKPVATNSTSVGRAANRRVEFVLVGN